MRLYNDWSSHNPGPEHWTNGGTAVANFGKEKRPIYEKAIQRGFSDALEIRDEPFGTSDMNDKDKSWMKATMHSLHFIGKHVDLSDFWEVFREIESGK